MNIYDEAHALANSIRKTEEYLEHKRLHAIACEDETNNALLGEFKRLQVQLQMAAVGRQQLPPEDVQRFQQLTTLLMMNSDVQAYLLAEMRLQKMLADIFKTLSDACGINLDFMNT